MDNLRSSDLAYGDAPSQERLRTVFAYWDGKRRGRPMPARADIDPAELRPYLPQLILLDVESEPLRFRYRLVGTEVTRIRRGLPATDPTGKYVDEVTHHHGTDAVLTHYRRVAQEGRPSLDTGSYAPSPDRHWLRFTRLVLPLSADGTTVNMLLVALVPTR